MTAPPLTHHDILALVEPFTRAGHAIDLAASRRLERRLVFKPTDRDGLRETLQLEGASASHWRLTRTLVHPAGVQATLEAGGARPGDLLARIAAVSPQRHFSAGSGWTVARSYSADGGGALTLQHATVYLEGLQLALRLPAPRRMAADLELTAGRRPLELPDDLLAVLGWNWARLVPDRAGWTSKLRLRGGAQARTERAEQALLRCAAHLAQTLAEPPARFHERWRAARWGVVFRRAIPLLMALSLIASVTLLPRLSTEGPPGLWMLLYHVPTALIALSFCLQELARFEIPPLPRRSALSDWQPVFAHGPDATARPEGPGGSGAH